MIEALEDPHLASQNLFGMAFSATSHVTSAACVALRGGGSEVAEDDLEEADAGALMEELPVVVAVRCSTFRVVLAMLRTAKVMR
jgi:hypothetical protein